MAAFLASLVNSPASSGGRSGIITPSTPASFASAINLFAVFKNRVVICHQYQRDFCSLSQIFYKSDYFFKVTPFFNALSAAL